jgi:hypothetical protein
VLFFSKGLYFYDRPNLLLLVIVPVQFTNLDICGRFWGKIGELGRNRPKKRILVSSVVNCGSGIRSTHAPIWPSTIALLLLLYIPTLSFGTFYFIP